MPPWRIFFSASSIRVDSSRSIEADYALTVMGFRFVDGW